MDSNIDHLPDHTRSVTVLAVSLSAEDQRILEAVFRHLPWKLKTVATLAQGLRLAASPTVRVVICEPELPGGNWKVLFNSIRDWAAPPRLIVASRLADERLWAEILNVGGYDVLATPFDTDELRRVLSYAVDYGGWQVPRLAKCR